MKFDIYVYPYTGRPVSQKHDGKGAGMDCLSDRVNFRGEEWSYVASIMLKPDRAGTYAVNDYLAPCPLRSVGSTWAGKVV